MSASDPDEEQVAAPPVGNGPAGSAPVPERGAVPAARRPWSPWSEVRGDLRGAATVVALLAISGFLAGLLWWALAPRAHFRITADGPVAIGDPSEELLAADDAIFALLLAGLGILAGALAWSLLRRRRGVAMLFALAVGTAAAAVIAWQFGQLLGPAPSHAAVVHVGGRVTTGLILHSPPALAVGPFFVVLVYLAAAVFARRDDLGRRNPTPPQPDPAAGDPGLAWAPADVQPTAGPQP